jgi:hypothetical protein
VRREEGGGRREEALLAAGRWQLMGLTGWWGAFYVEPCPATLLAGCRILGWVAMGL